MFFKRKRGSSIPLDIAAMTPRELADLPPFHPLAEDMMRARLRPFEPRSTTLWPWLAAR